MSVVVVVQAVAGRDDYTRATLASLDEPGGAQLAACPKVLYWIGPRGPRFTLPVGWHLVHDAKAARGHRRDLWAVMRDVTRGRDLVLFEDDIIACRNAVPYIVQWAGPLFTTFHNIQRKPYGAAPIDKREGFQGTQAFKAPAELVARFVAAGDTDSERVHLQGNNIGGDTRIGHLMTAWGEDIHTHRSLVQHVGVVSAHNPKATLTGHRAPVTDFDENLDALTLPVGGSPPWLLCAWPGGCLTAAVEGRTRCDAHTIVRRRPRPVVG